MYLIKYFDDKGRTCNAYVCATMAAVGHRLAAYCNSTISGNLPTVRDLSDGELVRYSKQPGIGIYLKDIITCMHQVDPNGDYDVQDALDNPDIYLDILKRWEAETGNHNYWHDSIQFFEALMV